MRLHLWLFLSLVGPFSVATAKTVRTIWLHPTDGAPIAVGTVTLETADTGYTVIWDDSKFGDHFLSMRPFKCLEGPRKLWCRVPYPYQNRRQITGGDLTDLEYDLLFLWKGAGEYGINMWNGIYYRLSADGNQLTGTLHEVDMDLLAAPPEDGNLRPITEDDLEVGDPDSHWLPHLTIE